MNGGSAGPHPRAALFIRWHGAKVRQDFDTLADAHRAADLALSFDMQEAAIDEISIWHTDDSRKLGEAVASWRECLGWVP